MGQACLSLQTFWGALLCKILTYALCTALRALIYYICSTVEKFGHFIFYFLIEGIKQHMLKHGTCTPAFLVYNLLLQNKPKHFFVYLCGS